MKDRQLMLAIMAQLEREKAISIPQLATMLKVNEEEVFDALETLVFAYDAASMRLDLRESFATLETYGKERLLRLTASETDALVDALRAAGLSDDDELVQNLIRTKSVLDESGTETARLRVISDTPLPNISETLAAACEDLEHHLLEIEYQGNDDASPQTRCVEPLRIFSKDGHRYLQAYCLEADGWRSFRLDRVLSAKQLEDVFTPRKTVPRPNVNLDAADARARIAFSPDCPVPNWRELTVTKVATGDAYVGTIPWTGSSWLPKQIVALMGKATVLEPESLVKECKEYANLLLQAASMHDSTIA